MWDYYANTIFFLCYCFCLCLLMGNFLSFSRVLFQINLKLFHFYFFMALWCWVSIFHRYLVFGWGFSLVFPLLQIIFYHWNQVILLNRLTRFLTFLLTIFCFQLLASFLEIFLIGIKFDLFSLVVFQIAPSLLLNLFLLLIFQPLFEKIYL